MTPVFTDPLAEATFVPADLPRDGVLALWSSAGTIDGADAELEVVLPSPVRPLRRTVPARLVPLGDVLDALVELPASQAVRPSVRAWVGGGPHRRGARRPRPPGPGDHPGRRGRLAAGPARPRGPGAPSAAGLGPAARGPRPAGRPASAPGGLTGPGRRRPLRRRRRPAAAGGRRPGRGRARGVRREASRPTSRAPRPGSGPSVGRRTRPWWPCAWSPRPRRTAASPG